MTLFERLEQLPEDPILSLSPLFTRDSRLEKVNLGVGAYRDEEGKPKVLSVVAKAEKILLDRKIDKEYLPIDGIRSFNEMTRKLVFGNLQRPMVTVQTIGASGALYLGAELISKALHRGNIYLPIPTWPNHAALLQRGSLRIKEYPYFDFQLKNLNYRKFLSFLKKMRPESIVLLHACCHNPTGVDPIFEQWKEISEVMKQKRLIPFFDFSYQGFGESIESDAKAVRFFAEAGHEMLVANSFAKNFGLYGERVGALSLISENETTIEKVLSQLKRIIRSCYSTPPKHGALIIETILNSPALTVEWEKELSTMRLRISEMRQQFCQLLKEISKLPYDFINQQRGFFTYLGLSRDQVLRLRKEYGVYMLEDSRINIGGLTKDNILYTVESITAVL